MRDYGGYREPYRGRDRGFGMRGSERPYDVGYRSELRGGNRGWSGWSDDRFGGPPERSMGGRERMTFRPRHEHEHGRDREMGDQLREGWQDLKRGVRNAFGGSGGYDSGWRERDRWNRTAGYNTRGARGWPGYYERGEAGGRFETRGRYGGDYVW